MNIYIMELEITKELKNPITDMPKLIKCIDDEANMWIIYSKTIFAYICGQICGILYYNIFNNNVDLEWLYVHEKLKKNHQSNWYNIWSRLLYELLIQESPKYISLYSLESGMIFYKNIWFSKIADSQKLESINLSKIKKI